VYTYMYLMDRICYILLSYINTTFKKHFFYKFEHFFQLISFPLFRILYPISCNKFQSKFTFTLLFIYALEMLV